MVIALLLLAGLGFCVEELQPLLRRQRLERERVTREVGRLALAINAKWERFGCARGMTEAEIARLRRTLAGSRAARGGVYRARQKVNPRTIRIPTGPSAVAPPPTNPQEMRD